MISLSLPTSLSTTSGTLPIAVDVDDLTVTGELTLTIPLVIAFVIFLLLAALLITLAVLLSRPSKKKKERTEKGAHRTASDKSVWRQRIDDVIGLYNSGGIDREEAFTRLAAVARDYATSVSGKDMTSHTLSDLAQEPRLPGNRRGLDLLRQTIEALYPAEFANAAVNAQARVTTVEQAADWVSTLVERWR